MFKRTSLTIALILGTTLLHADKKQLIDEMIRLNGIDQQLAESFKQLSQNPPKPFKGKLGEDQAKFDMAFDKTLKEEVAKIANNMKEEAMKKMAELFSKYFEEKDLEQINAFVKSEAGKKQKDIMPKVMDEMASAMMQTRQTLMPKMQEAIEKGLDAAQKAGISSEKIQALKKEREEQAQKQKDMMEKIKKMQEEKMSGKAQGVAESEASAEAEID